MNRFQWNLRYPDATEVRGFNVPIAAGGLPDEVDGTEVTPGMYAVVLDYGGAKVQAPLEVALDPRLHPGEDALTARLDLERRIHSTLDALDRAIDVAMDERDRLRSAIASGHLSEEQAHGALAELDSEINSLVQLDSRSSEGPLMHEAKLRSYLAYLAAEVELAYVRPTPAQIAVFQRLEDEAKTGEQKLQSAINSAPRIH